MQADSQKVVQTHSKYVEDTAKAQKVALQSIPGMCVFCLIYGPAVLGNFRLVCAGDILFHVSLCGAH